MMKLSITNILICLCLGIYKGVKAFTTASNSIFTEKAFFGKEAITDYTINLSNSTWLEAEGTCLSWNQTLMGRGLEDYYLYIRILAHRQTTWPNNTHVWLNRVRKANSTLWLNDMECETNGSLPWPVHGNNISTTQCLALNMTSPTNLEYVLFAAPCDKKMGFVCESFQGFYFDSIGYNIFYPFNIIEPINQTSVYPNFPSDECKHYLFHNFTCYAAEYNEDILTCTLFCAPLLSPPENIKLDIMQTNITTAVKSSSRLTIVSSTNFVIGDYPFCETMTTNTITSLGVTSTSQSNTDSSSTETSGETVVTETVVTTSTSSAFVETASELNTFSTEGVSSRSTESSSLHSETPSPSTSDGLGDSSSISTSEHSTTQTDTTAPTLAYSTTQIDTSAPTLVYSTTQTDTSAPTLAYSTTQTDTSAPTLVYSTTQTDTSAPTLAYSTTQADTTTATLEYSTTQGDKTTSTLGYPSSATNTTTPSLALTTHLDTTTPKEIYTTHESTTSINTIEHSITISSWTDTRSSTTTTEGTSSSVSPQFVTSLLTSTSITCSPCVCNNDTTANKTQEQIQEEIAQIKKNLTLEKSTLSSYTRQKISAPDKRWSSAALGSVGIVILVAAGSVVVLSDTQHFLRAIRVWRKRLSKYRFSKNPKP